MSATSLSNARRAAPRRATAPRPARRVSGPITGRARGRLAPQPTPTVGARALALVRSLPSHSLIDRLVRGRAWIPILGVLLAGLVTMQVEILKLGTSLGRSLELTTTLQSENEALQAHVATLADDQRIERLASAMGMTLPSSGMLTFLSGRQQGELGKAIANIHSPDPTNFAAALALSAASAALVAPTTTTAPGAVQATGQAATTTPTTTTSVTQSNVATGATSATATQVAPTTNAQGAAATGPVPTGTTAVGASNPTSSTGAAGLPSTSTTGTPTGG